MVQISIKELKKIESAAKYAASVLKEHTQYDENEPSAEYEAMKECEDTLLLVETKIKEAVGNAYERL